MVVGCARFGYELPVDSDEAPPEVSEDAAAMYTPTGGSSSAGADGGVPEGGSFDAAGGEPDMDAAGAAGTPGVGGSDAGTGAAGSDAAGGSEISAGGSDPGAAGAAGSSAGGGGCVYSAFDPPERLTGFLLTGTLWGPTLSADGMTLYFSRLSGSAHDLFVATRSDLGTSFSPAAALSALNVPGEDATPYVTNDGLSLYFASSRIGTAGARDIMVAARSGLSASFSSPRFVSELNTATEEDNPSLTADELTIVFESDRSGGLGAEDVWSAERASRGDPFSAPVNLTEVNSSSIDGGASISADGLTLFIASDRDAPAGARRIFVSTRPDRQSSFSTPERVSELDSGDAKHGPELRADGLELVFSSDRSGAQALWRATRHCL